MLAKMSRSELLGLRPVYSQLTPLLEQPPLRPGFRNCSKTRAQPDLYNRQPTTAH